MGNQLWFKPVSNESLLNSGFDSNSDSIPKPTIDSYNKFHLPVGEEEASHHRRLYSAFAIVAFELWIFLVNTLSFTH